MKNAQRCRLTFYTKPKLRHHKESKRCHLIVHVYNTTVISQKAKQIECNQSLEKAIGTPIIVPPLLIFLKGLFHPFFGFHEFLRF
jgi:hypothetical protein